MGDDAGSGVVGQGGVSPIPVFTLSVCTRMIRTS
jgi:hypothetical protein